MDSLESKLKLYITNEIIDIEFVSETCVAPAMPGVIFSTLDVKSGSNPMELDVPEEFSTSTMSHASTISLNNPSTYYSR